MSATSAPIVTAVPPTVCLTHDLAGSKIEVLMYAGQFQTEYRYRISSGTTVVESEQSYNFASVAAIEAATVVLRNQPVPV